MKYIALFLTLVMAACTSLPIIPEQAQRSTHEPRIERIMKRLTSALEPNPRRREIDFVIWSNDEHDAFYTFRVDRSERTLYIPRVYLELDDDALALAIGHEIGHIVEPGLPGGLVATIWIGSSGGVGTLVGTLSKWYWGVLAGSGTFLIVAPALLLIAARDEEGDCDLFGVDLMRKAGYNAAPAIDTWCGIFTRIDAFQDDFDREGRGTHPDTESRCRAMRNRLEHEP